MNHLHEANVAGMNSKAGAKLKGLLTRGCGPSDGVVTTRDTGFNERSNQMDLVGVER